MLLLLMFHSAPRTSILRDLVKKGHIKGDSKLLTLRRLEGADVALEFVDGFDILVFFDAIEDDASPSL